jgi:hypothetical protein
MSNKLASDPEGPFRAGGAFHAGTRMQGANPCQTVFDRIGLLAGPKFRMKVSVHPGNLPVSRGFEKPWARKENGLSEDSPNHTLVT